MNKLNLVSPQELTRHLGEQQKAAVLKWVADPFGNYVKTFPVTLPEGSSVEQGGQVKVPGSAPYQVCLTIHEVRVAKSASTRAARLPDGGVVLANGKWTWGEGNAPPPEETPPA